MSAPGRRKEQGPRWPPRASESSGLYESTLGEPSEGGAAANPAGDPSDAVSEAMRLRQRVKEVRGQLLARQGELSAELQRVESALRELVPSGLIVSSAPRIGTTPVTIPQVRHGDLRDFLAALLTANPQGLLTTEMEEAARTAKRRPRKNEIHTLVHALYESGYLTREGRRGSYLYRLKEGRGGNAARR